MRDTACMQAAHQFTALDVLTRAGAERDAAFAALGDDVEGFDSRLVSDVLRVTGRVGATLETRRALVELCAVVRAIDAAERERIELVELRDGLQLHAARTDDFAQFHAARVLLRTLAEVLDGGRATHREVPVRAQVALLHRELRAWLLEQLTGSSDGAIALVDSARRLDDARDAYRVLDPVAAVRADAIVHELLHGARHQPVTGLLGAAWVRGWSAVPIAGELLADEPLDLDLLARAITRLSRAPSQLLQVDRRRSPRWDLLGPMLQVGDGLRRAWVLPATRAGLDLAAVERPGWAILTTWELDFALVEADGHRALLGPTEFVVAACAIS